ncbi:hypothetical protein PIB30_083911 [Stylosanthes scabra]|uniref:Uncharacterized protein n=1 Tax=Stylosanthes scabra TaxID=79078 RepID=A0ABU6SSL9_9FABA|nr:hypothetical protein [Stylosanthes scabra]
MPPLPPRRGDLGVTDLCPHSSSPPLAPLRFFCLLSPNLCPLPSSQDLDRRRRFVDSIFLPPLTQLFLLRVSLSGVGGCDWLASPLPLSSKTTSLESFPFIYELGLVPEIPFSKELRHSQNPNP